jgi:hypothetical protein
MGYSLSSCRRRAALFTVAGIPAESLAASRSLTPTLKFVMKSNSENEHQALDP